MLCGWKKIRLRLPIHTLDGVVCFGNVGCSPFLLGFCAERDVTISFLTEYGRFLARVQGPVSGNVLLRREQYRRADDLDFPHSWRAFINGKIANCRALLNRAMRDHPEKMDTDAVSNAANHLTGLLKSLGRDLPLDEVRGTEGDGAHVYFGVFDHLIIRHKEDFSFTDATEDRPWIWSTACSPFSTPWLCTMCALPWNAPALIRLWGFFIGIDRAGQVWPWI